MKVIITGMSGFVGQNLHEYLREYNIEVRGLSLRDKNWALEIDKDADVFIHLAGKAHDLKHVSNGNEYYETNFRLTKMVFDIFKTSSASKFIFVSSVKAVADTVVGYLSEDIIPLPQTHYGKSKLLAEQYILESEIAKTKQIYILRPCMIHGPGNKGNLNLLLKLIENNIPFPLGCFENKRSFLGILNFCFLVKELIINNNVNSGVYNLADSGPLSTLEVYKILAKSLGIKSRILKVPKGIINTVAVIGDYLKLPLNTDKLQKLTSNYIVDNSKILLAIDKKLPLSSEEGMLITGKSYLNG